MTRHKERPFFASLSTLLVHTPYLPTPDNYKPGMDKRHSDSARNYKPGVEYLDKLVGRVIAALEKLGLRERTVIFCSGDNGSAANGLFYKGSATEESPFMKRPPKRAVSPAK